MGGNVECCAPIGNGYSAGCMATRGRGAMWNRSGRSNRKLARAWRIAHQMTDAPMTPAAVTGTNMVPTSETMDVSHHKSTDVLQTYVRDADPFRDHAGTGLLKERPTPSENMALPRATQWRRSGSAQQSEATRHSSFWPPPEAIPAAPCEARRRQRAS